jgi:hypothetical protein
VLLRSCVGHCKNKGVVLREEEESRREDRRGTDSGADDVDPRRGRRAEAAGESVGDAGSRRGGRGRDERDEDEKGSGDKKLRVGK